MKHQKEKTKAKEALNYMWLALAVVLTFLYGGNLAVSIAAWLAPLFMVRFIRSQRPLKGLLIAWLAVIVIMAILNREVFPMPGVAYYFATVILALIAFLPYVADRLLRPRLSGFSATLILPFAWVTVEYLKSFAPWGSWGCIAYTQVDNLPLLQLTSITGIWGIVFLMVWFTTVVNWIWEQEFAWTKIRKGVLTFAAILCLILLAGGIRLRNFPPNSDTIRIASLTVSNTNFMKAAYEAKHGRKLQIFEDISQSDPLTIDLYMALSDFTQFPDDPKYTSVHQALDALHKDLFELSRREARAGAKIITWSEGNSFVLKRDEPTFLEQARKLAQEEKIILATPLYIPPGIDSPSENKLLIVTADGEIATAYHKTKLVPGETSIPGDGTIPFIKGSFGKLAGVICYDMDFPGYIRETGKLGIDILLVPSGDWKGITPIHGDMAVFRAVENGFSMVRQASRGLSKAVDYQGRTLAAMDYFHTNEHVMVAQVPTEGVTTIYARIGDLFAWLAIVGFIVVLVQAMVRGKKLDTP